MKIKIQKKAQMSFFIIIGIILLGVILIFSFALTSTNLQKLYTHDSVESYAKNCFQLSSECTLYNLGMNNVNIEFKENFQSLEQADSSSYGYFIDYAEQCQDFSQFKSQNITKGNIEPKINFNYLDTYFDISQKITLKNNEQTQNLEKFSSELPVRFSQLHYTAEKLRTHNLTLIDKEYINADLLEDESLSIAIYENNPHIISITDKNSKLRDENYKFVFLKFFS